jgi:hypothetical protein
MEPGKIFYITFRVRVALIRGGLSTDTGTTFDQTPFSLDDILNPFVSTFQVLAAFSYLPRSSFVKRE